MKRVNDILFQAGDAPIEAEGSLVVDEEVQLLMKKGC